MEAVRVGLEELDKLERCAEKVLWSKKRMRSGDHVAHVGLDFGLGWILDQCVETAERSVETHLAKAELEEKTNGGVQGFYAAKRRMEERYTSSGTSSGNLTGAISIKLPSWRVQEKHGRALDLTEFHQTYLSIVPHDITQRASLDYPKFVQELGAQRILALDTPCKAKSARAYRKFLSDLLGYLRSFQSRAQALLVIDESALEKRFDSVWAAGQARGWERTDALSSTTDLEHQLLIRGLKAGGRQQDRQARLTIAIEKGMQDPGLKKARLFDARETARLEFKIDHIAAALGTQVWEDTCSSYTRERTLTQQEIAKEQEQLQEQQTLAEQKIATISQSAAATSYDSDDLEDDLAEDSDDNDDGDTNQQMKSKAAPKEFQGQPIQPWMYKLYGLKQQYTCEICGNFSYRGRRAFDRHFQDSRHAHAMRLLGIPNTAHFHDITSIKDAKALHEKLQNKMKLNTFDTTQDQQIQDKQGNVYSKKTYQDLKAQGLID